LIIGRIDYEEREYEIQNDEIHLPYDDDDDFEDDDDEVCDS